MYWNIENKNMIHNIRIDNIFNEDDLQHYADIDRDRILRMEFHKKAEEVLSKYPFEGVATPHKNFTTYTYSFQLKVDGKWVDYSTNLELSHKQIAEMDIAYGFKFNPLHTVKKDVIFSLSENTKFDIINIETNGRKFILTTALINLRDGESIEPIKTQ